MRRRRALRRALSPLSRRKVLAALAVVAVVGASGALAGVLAAGSSGRVVASKPRPAVGATARRSRTQLPRSTTAVQRVPSDPATVVGPYGVTATWMTKENELPGTTAWRITGAPKGSSIDGFASRVEARAGQRVTLYVSSDAPTYHVLAFRMGYYHGTGARLVWRSGTLAGHVQPACTVTSRVNMVSCDDWSPSLTVSITGAWVQGDYLFKLVGSANQQSYVPLTVWDPSLHAAYLLKNDVLTWQAWNPYGGYDYYEGIGSCPPAHYPLCSRARIVSFDRPYGYGEGAGDFLANELPLVRLVEQHGLDVAYGTDLTLVEHPSFALQQRSILSLGHDECWSLRERDALYAAASKGVNVAFFAASAILRHVRLQPSPLGANREEIDYRDSSKDPLDGHGDPLRVTGNTWASPPADWSEVPFVGEAYGGFVEPGAHPAPLVVSDASAWVFAGTGLRDGSKVPGVLLSDFDELDQYVHPANLQVLASSPIPASESQSDLPTYRGYAYSDMTYYSRSPGGAGIFDSGTNNWIPALDTCRSHTDCPAPVIDEITGNLLRLFGRGPAGVFQPSVGDVGQIRPGS